MWRQSVVAVIYLHKLQQLFEVTEKYIDTPAAFHPIVLRRQQPQNVLYIVM
jgi:hypothetical protein